ncbi:DUF5675 family protein [Flavicella sp.]|uniref:DUF5675 family protein n=1 Tax=Flavicella sp. TaxID=2957742 RepID=UPI0026108FB1|nr:DUF5675 family protein [Flavicella sp.]MDG1805927.1 DUF5675 family protein [Flavicella sp.]
MVFTLHRTYLKEGTHGALFYKDIFFCFIIELPYLNNIKYKSCIPEGTYTLTPRYSKKFKNHLLVNGVKNRSLILLHPANDAQKELKGCLAPVSYLTGVAKGLYSKPQLEKLVALCYQAFDKKETVQLIIKS